MDTQNIKPIVDALIFASETPLSIQRIKQILEEGSQSDVTIRTVREAIEEINRDNRDNQRGFFLQEVAGGFQYRTRPNYAAWVKRLKKAKVFRLTQSTLETLAIIAYKQPIIRAEVEKIRGVDSGGVIKNLLERDLLKIMGRKNIPGRPFLFGTTKRFLEVFGLEKLSDLPSLREFEELDEAKLPTILREKVPDELFESSEEVSEEIDSQVVSDEELGHVSAMREEGTEVTADDRSEKTDEDGSNEMDGAIPTTVSSVEQECRPNASPPPEESAPVEGDKEQPASEN